MNQMILQIGIHLAQDYYVPIKIGGFLKCIIENTVILYHFKDTRSQE